MDNSINLDNYINITSQNNIINFGYPKSTSISQLALLDTKIIILLSTNDLVVYDSASSEKPISRHFLQEIRLIQVFQEKLFILQNQLITQIDIKNLDDLQKYDLKEKPYLLTFLDASRNFVCIYANEINEIIYMKSYFLTEIKRLYKETENIQKLIYQNNILLWCTKSALKVFNLETKTMLIKADLSNYIIPNEDFHIECYLYKNLLGIIYQKKYILIYYLDTNNKSKGTSYEIFNLSINPSNKNEYFICFWMNIAFNKVCILSLKDNIICLDIAKIEMNHYIKNYFYSSKKLNCYFHKEYKYIQNPQNNFRYIQGKYNMYIYGQKEIFLIFYSKEKEENFFQYFLNSDVIDFNDIKDIYKSLDLNKKYFVLVKLIEKDSKNNFNLFLNNKIFFEQYKYLYEEIFDLKRNDNNKNKDKIIILYNNYIFYLLKISTDIFIKLYTLIKNYFNIFLSDKAKEKLIKALIQKQQYNILKNFINDNNRISFTASIDNFIQSIKSANESNGKTDELIIYTEALLNQKASQLRKAIKLFIDIKKSDEIFNLLLNQNQANLIFEYDILFTMFNESKLVSILDSLYSPLNIDICHKFYSKLFSLTDEVKITKFTYHLILFEKYRLLINNEIIEKLFNISIRNNNEMIFENMYDKYKYKSDNKLFLTKFIREVFNMFNIDNKKIIDENNEELMKSQNIDIYILLLNNINNYKKIIDIYIDNLEQPEQCIKYIENSNLNQNIKLDIYNYLGDKINNSKSLSDAKKFYYITQFQDDITIQKPDILKLFDNIDYKKKNNDDFDYILLILKELRLKLNTLKTAKEMSYHTSKEKFKELKSNLKRGKIMKINVEKPVEKNVIKNKNNNNNNKNDNKIKCDFDECDNRMFEYGENIIIFKECNHCFHKECFKIIKDIYKSDNNIYFIDNNFCPKCFDII